MTVGQRISLPARTLDAAEGRRVPDLARRHATPLLFNNSKLLASEPAKSWNVCFVFFFLRKINEALEVDLFA
jgi:hypothetical protein